ncbi:MAG: hypothetical protein Athens071424_177 [Parcubacteria group bacterium Athens0714_24]|nr:MAG: hypothetical protein Athens071424_177 [Parcubacteria group bacterium Athens0714_24]
MDTSSERKAQIKMLIMAVLIMAMVAGLWVYQTKIKKPQAQQPQKPQITINQVPVDKAPEKFPDDIPIEAGARILQNYNASSPDGRFQATRVFESAQTLDENLAIYKNYFTKNGWTITNEIKDQPNIRYISAAKDKTRAQATIRENATTKIVSVDVSVTYLR